MLKTLQFKVHLSIEEQEKAAANAAVRAAGKCPAPTKPSTPTPSHSLPSQYPPTVHVQAMAVSQSPVSGPEDSTAPNATVLLISYTEATSSSHASSVTALGSVDKSLAIPEAVFSLSERSQASTDFKHAIVGKLSFGKPTNQVDYILGKNPKSISYLVGYGQNYPIHVHHRGASITSISLLQSSVGCVEGFETWYKRSLANPNIIHGALVGGPNANDEFSDDRSN